MNDELTELDKATRKAFRAFYGEDDPILFSDLSAEQRKRFEDVAKSFESSGIANEVRGFVENLDALEEAMQDRLAGLVSGTKLSDSMRNGERADTFGVIAKGTLDLVSEMKERYERRIPHR